MANDLASPQLEPPREAPQITPSLKKPDLSAGLAALLKKFRLDASDSACFEKALAKIRETPWLTQPAKFLEDLARVLIQEGKNPEAAFFFGDLPVERLTQRLPEGALCVLDLNGFSDYELSVPESAKAKLCRDFYAGVTAILKGDPFKSLNLEVLSAPAGDMYQLYLPKPSKISDDAYGALLKTFYTRVAQLKIPTDYNDHNIPSALKQKGLYVLEGDRYYFTFSAALVPVEEGGVQRVMSIPPDGGKPLILLGGSGLQVALKAQKEAGRGEFRVEASLQALMDRVPTSEVMAPLPTLRSPALEGLSPQVYRRIVDLLANTFPNFLTDRHEIGSEVDAKVNVHHLCIYPGSLDCIADPILFNRVYLEMALAVKKYPSLGFQFTKADLPFFYLHTGQLASTSLKDLQNLLKDIRMIFLNNNLECKFGMSSSDQIVIQRFTDSGVTDVSAEGLIRAVRLATSASKHAVQLFTSAALAKLLGLPSGGVQQRLAFKGGAVSAIGSQLDTMDQFPESATLYGREALTEKMKKMLDFGAQPQTVLLLEGSQSGVGTSALLWQMESIAVRQKISTIRVAKQGNGGLGFQRGLLKSLGRAIPETDEDLKRVYEELLQDGDLWSKPHVFLFDEEAWDFDELQTIQDFLLNVVPYPHAVFLAGSVYKNLGVLGPDSVEQVDVLLPADAAKIVLDQRPDLVDTGADLETVTSLFAGLNTNLPPLTPRAVIHEYSQAVDFLGGQLCLEEARLGKASVGRLGDALREACIPPEQAALLGLVAHIGVPVKPECLSAFWEKFTEPLIPGVDPRSFEEICKTLLRAGFLKEKEGHYSIVDSWTHSASRLFILDRSTSELILTTFHLTDPDELASPRQLELTLQHLEHSGAPFDQIAEYLLKIWPFYDRADRPLVFADMCRNVLSKRQDQWKALFCSEGSEQYLPFLTIAGNSLVCANRDSSRTFVQDFLKSLEDNASPFCGVGSEFFSRVQLWKNILQVKSLGAAPTINFLREASAHFAKIFEDQKGILNLSEGLTPQKPDEFAAFLYRFASLRSFQEFGAFFAALTDFFYRLRVEKASDPSISTGDCGQAYKRFVDLVMGFSTRLMQEKIDFVNDDIITVVCLLLRNFEQFHVLVIPLDRSLQVTTSRQSLALIDFQKKQFGSARFFERNFAEEMAQTFDRRLFWKALMVDIPWNGPGSNTSTKLCQSNFSETYAREHFASFGAHFDRTQPFYDRALLKGSAFEQDYALELMCNSLKAQLLCLAALPQEVITSADLRVFAEKGNLLNALLEKRLRLKQTDVEKQALRKAYADTFDLARPHFMDKWEAQEQVRMMEHAYSGQPYVFATEVPTARQAHDARRQSIPPTVLPTPIVVLPAPSEPALNAVTPNGSAFEGAPLNTDEPITLETGIQGQSREALLRGEDTLKTQRIVQSNSFAERIGAAAQASARQVNQVFDRTEKTVDQALQAASASVPPLKSTLDALEKPAQFVNQTFDAAGRTVDAAARALSSAGSTVQSAVSNAAASVKSTWNNWFGKK